MTVELGEEEFSAICPYLGLVDGADSHATYAADANRCYRLPNPTRIAIRHQETYCLEDNHTACPVFRGEGIPRRQPAAAAAVPPKGRERSSARRTQPLGGRVSMRVATIGLIAMAVVVILVAVVIQQAVGGSGNNSNQLSAADVGATNAALKGQSTRTAASLTPAATGSPDVGTPNPSQTPGTGTPSATATPGTSGKTYTVKAGDNCDAIASASNITLQQLLDANKMAVADCYSLQIGQVLKFP